jgi:hypothetical protein
MRIKKGRHMGALFYLTDKMWNTKSGRALYCADYKQQHDSAQYCHEQAFNAERVNADTKEADEETTDNGAYDAYNDIGDGAHAGIRAHNHAGNPASNGTQNNP